MPEIRIIVPVAMDMVLDSLVRAGLAGNKSEIVRSAITQYLSTIPTVWSKNYDLETVFSPDGRVFQVEYAIESTMRDRRLTVGICSKDNIVLIKKTFNKSKQFLKTDSYFRDTRYITDAVAVSFSGLSMDGHLILREALQYVEKNQSKKINIQHLAEELSFFIHSYTLKKNLRILGAAFVMCGLDLENIPRLFSIGPSGAIFNLNTYARGIGQGEAKKILTKGKIEELSLEEAITLGIKSMSLQSKSDLNEVIIDVIDTQSKKFRELSLEEKLTSFEKI